MNREARWGWRELSDGSRATERETECVCLRWNDSPGHPSELVAR